MIDQMRALAAENANPTHCDRMGLRNSLKPVAAIQMQVQNQLATYRTMLSDAELANDDPALDGKFEHIRQTIAAAEKKARAFEELGRDVIKAMAQLDRYLPTAMEDVERVVTLRSAPDGTPPAPVVDEVPTPKPEPTIVVPQPGPPGRALPQTADAKPST